MKIQPASMKTSILSNFPAFSCVFGLAISLLSQGNARAAEVFTATLLAEKSTCILGEPVMVTATIGYRGQTAIEVNHPLDRGRYKEIVEVARDEDGKFDRFLTKEEYADALQDRLLLGPLRFEPGTNMVRKFVVHRWYRGVAPKENTNLLVFAKAGECRIRFTVVLDEQKFTNEVRITVVEPTTDADRGAWAWLQHGNRLERFCELDYLPADLISRDARVARERLLKPLDEMLVNYRDSAYSRCIRRIAPERQPQ